MSQTSNPIPAPSHFDAFNALLLQAAGDGRGQALFGDSFDRAYRIAPAFMIGEEFPSVYLEHPLSGDPYLDVTVLYGKLERGLRINSPLAAGTDALLDWYAQLDVEDDRVCFGFELDTKNPTLPLAAVHFQPRSRTDLVESFCNAIGEPSIAKLYLEQSSRMPEEWGLDFFGFFRGRPDAPLRMCGYIDAAEVKRCAADVGHLTRRLDQIQFSAYDDSMISKLSQLMEATPDAIDFQIDVLPDGSLAQTFAIDIQFKIEQPGAVRASFDGGVACRVLSLLEEWGVADNRWKLDAQAAFARAIPVQLPNGNTGDFALTLLPQWVKARWHDGVLQPAKLYLNAHAGITKLI